MTAWIGILAFAVLFAVFAFVGQLRPDRKCASKCGACSGACHLLESSDDDR